MPIRRLFGLLAFALSLLSSPVLAQSVSFVDESGASTGTYLERTRVRVRVTDTSANTSPGAVDTVAVTLATALAGDSEILTLTETGVGTGVFEGSMALETGTAPYLSGVLETALQAGPPVVRDTLTATYSPSVTDTAGMAGARIELVDDRGRPAAAYTEADWVNVRVEDHVPYNDPVLRDGVTVAVFVFSVSDEEFITLQETGNATGIYEGRIRAVLHATSDDDGLVGAPVGNLVQGQYALSDAQEHVDAQVPLLGSRAEILDAQGEPADFVAESSTIRLRAIDRLAGGPALVDTVVAGVFSEIGLDEEAVTLTETAADSGVFEADLPTSIDATLPGNGRLETAEDAGPPHRFDTITLSYPDSFSASSDTAVTYGSETLFLDGFGNDAEAYAMGSPIVVRVIDHNYDPNDSVQVTVRALRSGDIEIFTLWVTEDGPGIFEGSLPIATATNYVSLEDDELQPFPVDTIEAMHTDALGNTASGDRAEVRNGKLEFFDEQGRPTQELVEGGLARVRLYGAQLNSSPYDAQQVSVLARSALAGDEESFALVETGTDTGIFEGTFGLAFTQSGASNGNGTLETSNGGSPYYEQDTVTVEALDASTAATTVGTRIWLINRFGEGATTFAVGDLVGVRVEDHNVDDPQVRQTLQVVVVNSQAEDVESVSLLETGYATGVFEGLIPSRLLTSIFVNDGTLDVQEGDVLQARHVWLHAPRIATDDAVVTGGSVRFVDAQGRPAESYLEAATAYVRLVYAAGNSSPAADSVNVTVSAAISQDVESLVLTETGANTGIFTGSIALRTGAVSPGDGFLQTQRSTNPPRLDTLTVTHAWPGGSASATATLTGPQVWFVDASGNPADSFAQGSRAYIRVEDHNADQSGIQDTVQVMLSSLASGDYDSVTLVETDPDSGIFAGSLPMVVAYYSPAYDGQLRTYAPEQIEAVYSDAGGVGSAVRAQILLSSVEFLDAQGQVTTELLENGPARVRLFYATESYTYSQTASVGLESRYGNDEEGVTVTSQSWGSPVYEGTIQLRSVAPGGAVFQNGTLETSTGGAPAYLPDEVTAMIGYGTQVVPVLPSRARFIDLFGREASSFAVGDRVGVRVEDHNLDDPLLRRTLTVAVRSALGDLENVTLTETGYDTNVYEGSTASAAGTPAGSDGTLQVEAGETIEASHANAGTPAATVAQATMTGASVLFVDAAGDPAGVYLEGSRAYVRVADASASGTVTATLRTALGTDVEALLLTETSSGVFTGWIDLGVSGLSPGNGVLTTVQDLGTPHEYDTLRAEYGGATATAATLSSRTGFIDANGAPAESFARDSRAYVRVEDHTLGQPGVLDTAQVTVRSLTTGDQETLALLETGLNSNVFEGSLPLDENISWTTYPVPGDGTLQSVAVEEIEAVHTDWTGSTSSSDRARVDYASVEIVDEQGVATVELLENGQARLRVFYASYELYYSDTTTVSVRSHYGNDSEYVTLNAVSYGSPIYEGTIQLQSVAPGGALAQNGTLETSTSGAPAYRPDEVTAEGSSPAVATVLPSRARFLNLQGQAVAQYAVGSAVRVRVEDHNAGSAGQVDTLTVNVSTPADSEVLTATETGAGTGVFEGSLSGSGSTPVSADGTLQSAPGVTVTAEHGNINTPAATVIQAVFSGNFAPLAVDDSAETVEAPVVIAVLANDSDPDAETLQVAAVTQGANGAVAVNGDQTVTYTPAAGFTGTDAFAYVAADPRGGQARATVTVTVIEDNAPPTPVADTAATDEDQAVNIPVLANDTDPDSDPLAVRAVGTPMSGTAVIEPDGTITYTPEPDWSGQATFTYMVEDPSGLTAYATVTVTVTPVNDPPVANDDAASVAEDGSAFVFVLDNDGDVENDALDIVSITQGASGTVALNEFDDVTYTPAANFHGTDSFTYTLSDGNGGTDTAAVAVTVTPANDAPVAVDDSATTDEDTAVTVAVLANDTDADNDTLDVYLVTAPLNGVPALNADDTVTFTPAPGFHGTATFYYQMRDGSGANDLGQVTITVNDVNDLPVAVDDSFGAYEDTETAIPVLGNDSDADGDTLSIASVTQGANGTVAITPYDSVIYTPTPDFFGTDSFTYTVSDGNGGTDTATVTVSVEGTNDAPVAGDDSASVAEDSSVTVNVLGNDDDADDDTLAVTAVTQGTNGSVTLNPVTYTPSADLHGTDSFTYTVSDGNGGSDTATVTVTVSPVNDAPIANDDTASVVEDGSVAVNVLGNDGDVDGDALTVTAVTQGANGAVTLNPVTYTPSPNFFGTDSFTYTVSDGNGGVDTATVTVTVAPSNDALTANDDSATVAEDGSTTVAVLGNDSDPENDVLSIQSVTQGTNGAVAIAGTQVTYTPNADFHGADSFTYTASDGNGGIDSATVTVTVTPVNDDPVAGGDTASVVEDGSVAITVLGNDADVDDDLLSVTSVTQGTHGAVAVNPDDTVTYTPEADYNGADSFTYTVSDGNGGEDTATVDVTVGAANDAPVASDDSASTAEDNPVTVSVLGNDTDLENDTLSVSAVTQGANGSVAIAGSQVTYTPGANFNGTDAFTYTANDGNGGTDTATVTVTVAPVNDAPVANDDPASVAEDGSVTVAVLGNDTDADNDTLAVTAVTQGAHGAVTLNPVTYTPAANYNGTDVFTYTIADGNGGTDTATVNVTVGAANDAPVANDDTATVAEDGTVTVAVLANDTDLDNDTLTVTAVTQGANGTVTLNPVTYTPAADYNGPDSFTYTASDGNGGTDTATVMVTVTAVNDAPVAADDSASTLAETAATIPVRNNDTDIDSATLTITAVTQGAHGTVAINGGLTVTYTPATAWIGPDSFTYTISDGAGGTATATVNVDVQAPPRVSTNIQVLYAFNEGSGTTVNDTSGVGTPLNLTIGSASAVTWLPGALSIDSSTLVQSAGTATKVINACKSSNEVTVEAWVLPANLSQTGPAAIVTISQNATKRDVTLGQSGTGYNGQLRTSTTSQGGTQTSAAGVATLNLSHLVYTRSSTGAVRIYLNGTQVATATLSGNFSGWSSYNLALGGELSGTRYWTGDLHLVAIYSRALTATEVRQNWLAGAN